jgi:hypothetical protein
LAVLGVGVFVSYAIAQPNIVVIMTDDQTMESLEQMSLITTPTGPYLATSALQREGVTFLNSYVSTALCAPSPGRPASAETEEAKLKCSMQRLAASAFGLLLLVLGAAPAAAQSGCSNIATGAVLTAAQWQACFQKKTDFPLTGPLSITGLTVTGGLTSDSYKASSGIVLTEATTSRTLSSGDNGKIIVTTSGSPVTITVPAGLGAGFSCLVVQNGAGQVGFSPLGTTVNSYTSLVHIAGQFASATLVATGADVLVLAGTLQ